MTTNVVRQALRRVSEECVYGKRDQNVSKNVIQNLINDAVLYISFSQDGRLGELKSISRGKDAVTRLRSFGVGICNCLAPFSVVEDHYYLDRLCPDCTDRAMELEELNSLEV